ncbi:MAG: transcription-repair coupling factor [Candidatus Sumerlaeaceae bacterium]
MSTRAPALSQSLTSQLATRFARTSAFERVSRSLARAGVGEAVYVAGLRGSALATFAAALAQGEGRVPWPFILLVTSNAEKASDFYDDLSFFGQIEALHFPKSELLPYEEEEPSLEEQLKRLEVLHALCSLESARQPYVCVSSIEALLSRVPRLELLREHLVTLTWGATLDTAELAHRLVALGYERVPTVERRGEFSIRGGIVDVFPLDTEHGIRVDLFGTEIESLRWFDVHTQRSLKREGEIEAVTILPAREHTLFEVAIRREGDSDQAQLTSLIELLPPSALIIFDTPETYPLLAEHFHQIVERRFRERGGTERGLPAPHELYLSLDELKRAANAHKAVYHTVTEEDRAVAVFDTHSFDGVTPSLEYYLSQFRKQLAQGRTVCVVCDNAGQAQRMDELLAEQGLPGFVVPNPNVDVDAATDRAQREFLRRFVATSLEQPLQEIVITVGDLHKGFVSLEAGLYVVTDREIFGRYRRRPIHRKLYKGMAIADIREIKPGEYVVHRDHGIGRFEGIRTQVVDGRVCDFLDIAYAEGGRLLVPVEKIAYVYKYTGPDQAEPQLDKLGSKRWIQRRKKSKEAVEKLARELAQLYARRELARGYAYGPDTHEQIEFEASFLYPETPDQLRAIAEVKADMRSDKPMDRLLCGDVGFGKTEVAIRAAFKAIQESKQVALLCPTTILAQQHYNTFRERFAGYRIRVELLSRFRSPSETKAVLEGLRRGEVHMVIGTHALLSKNVKFQDLGLVIVDEEQRFGVRQKERFKEMRANVDFLSLSATPIPRTLYMALSGLRSMSLITTPPANRHPVKTRLIHFDPAQIEEAILRELNRGGQVFFVHNRIQTIEQVAERLREIVPTARIAVAHGQMPDDELEEVMLKFIAGDYDVLVSTTIIENGLDIPNVNTIIINRADAFGLAQLYQLRGRVGRESRQAYAYLIVPQGQPITEAAVARLAAIEEFAELGSGFHIAVRDLEIRGAGNLLGREQHGTIADVGFELYCKMLEEAVAQVKGELQEQERREVEIQWKLAAHIPADYVPVESQRVALYRRIVEAQTLQELEEITEEIRDRYGEVPRELGDGRTVESLPETVENLLAVAAMRLLARRHGIEKIVHTSRGLKLHRPDLVRDYANALRKCIRNGQPEIYIVSTDCLEFEFRDWSTTNQVRKALHVLKSLDSPKQTPNENN